MKILGIDPGYERIGIAVLEKENNQETLIYSACFKTPATIPFAERLVMIGNEIARIVKDYQPNALAIEELFFNQNTTTAMKVAEARGVIIYEAQKGGLTVHEYTPGEIKVAVTGYGKASKEDVRKMVPLLLKNTDVTKKIDDEVDAIAAAITGSASIRH